jgi:hypothetical protein
MKLSKLILKFKLKTRIFRKKTKKTHTGILILILPNSYPKVTIMKCELTHAETNKLATESPKKVLSNM